MGAFMPRYSEERKAAVLKKLLPPQNRSVVSVAAEEGISDVTLYSWLKQCRQQVQRWKEACLQGAGMQEDRDKAAQKQKRESRKTIKKLKAEVRRKDKALAETTSLLVLSKKLEALYGEDPDSSEDD
jgi:transposase-like protein